MTASNQPSTGPLVGEGEHNCRPPNSSGPWTCTCGKFWSEQDPIYGGRTRLDPRTGKKWSKHDVQSTPPQASPMPRQIRSGLVNGTPENMQLPNTALTGRPPPPASMTPAPPTKESPHEPAPE